MSETGWKNAPAGLWRGTIQDHWVQKNERTGSIELAFRIRLLQNLDDPGWKGSTFSRILWIPVLPSTVETWVAPVLEVLEVPEVDLARMDSRHPKAFKLIGMNAIFRCAHFEHKGRSLERWYFHLDSNFKKLSPEELEEFAGLMNPFVPKTV